MSSVRAFVVLSLVRVVVIAAAMPATAAGGAFLVTVDAHCEEYDLSLVEEGDATRREGTACPRTVAAESGLTPRATASLNERRERSSFRHPDEAYGGHYVTESWAASGSVGDTEARVAIERERGYTAFSEGGLITWQETRLAAGAAGETATLSLYRLDNPFGSRCGLAFRDSATGEEHGLRIPEAAACALLP